MTFMLEGYLSIKEAYDAYNSYSLAEGFGINRSKPQSPE